ncbi:MAG: Uma2 family endonuclease [Gammaproteobacteria bacterium]|nr:Uma2 family endonuclease [Gammaproteobacteria bacterium]
MSQPDQQPARYADLLDLPENVVGEILDGELHTHPRPAPKHARAYSVLGGSLGESYDWGEGGPGGWWILDEPEIHLSSNVLVPDLAGWRRERMPELPDSAWFELSPDWVCEILSPSTARTDRITKMPIYACEGVKHLWLVDPDLQTLEIYKLNASSHWTLISTLKDDDILRCAPFDKVEFSLRVLWG